MANGQCSFLDPLGGELLVEISAVETGKPSHAPAGGESARANITVKKRQPCGNRTQPEPSPFAIQQSMPRFASAAARRSPLTAALGCFLYGTPGRVLTRKRGHHLLLRLTEELS